MELMDQEQAVTSKRKSLRAVLFGCTALAAVVFQAPAFADEVKFSIAGQPLASALLDFGRQSGRQVVFTPATVAHMTTKGLNGSFEPTEALRRLSAGSSLVFTEREDGSFIVRTAAALETNSSQGVSYTAPASDAPASATPTEGSAAPRPKTPVVAAGGRENDAASALAGDDFDEIIVNAKRVASTATKFQLNVIDTPQSIKAITRDIIEIASIRQFTDLAKVDASTTSRGVVNGTQGLTFRGFDANFSSGIMIDGFRTQTSFPLDLGVFERIEILKGPSSTIYGTNAVGGMVNAITKQPSETPEYMAAAKVGSFDFYRFEAGSAGPLTDDKRLTYSLYGSYESGGDFVDFADNESKAVFGALRYELNDATTADIKVNYQKRDFTPSKGIATFDLNGDLEVPDIPVERYVGPSWAERTGEFISFQGGLSHTLKNDWKIKLSAQYSDSSLAGNLIDLRDLVASNGNINTFFLGYDEASDKVWGADLSLMGDFELFGRNHSFYISGDYRETKYSESFTRGTPLAAPFNILNPDYSVFGVPRTRLQDFNGLAGQVFADKTSVVGGTMQLMLHPTERLSLLLGGRIDHQKLTSSASNGTVSNGMIVLPAVSAPAELTTTEFTSQIGATFEITSDVNLYATYGESFVPQLGFTFDGRPFKPEGGWQAEGGVKGNFWDQKLTLTLAAFHMVRNNIIGTNPNGPPANPGAIEIGEQRSRGIEFEAFGKISSGWTFLASAAYIDAIFSKTASPLDLGSRAFNVPKFAFSLFTTYEIQKGPLSGLGFSGGVVNKSDRVWGQPSLPWIQHQVKAGGYTTVDLRTFYQAGNLLFDVRVNNVLNEKYYNNWFPGLKGGVFAGRPREVVAGITYRY